tara:strand:- start:49 stop:219 length:171 start_codon:yes stop_codon:yes gene_type:complete
MKASEAIEKLGGPSSAARILGLSRMAIWKWVNNHDTIPEGRVDQVRFALGAFTKKT